MLPIIVDARNVFSADRNKVEAASSRLNRSLEGSSTVEIATFVKRGARSARPNGGHTLAPLATESVV